MPSAVLQCLETTKHSGASGWNGQLKRNCQLQNHRSQATTGRDIANTPITASGRRVHHGRNGEEVRSHDGLPKMPERDRHALQTRVERACSAVWRRRPLSRHWYLQLTWQLIDRGPRRGGEKRGHEDRGRDAVMGAADSLQEQAS